MFGTDVFVKNACKVEQANIIKTEGTSAIVEMHDKLYEATYDRDAKCFYVDDSKVVKSA